MKNFVPGQITHNKILKKKKTKIKQAWQNRC